METYVVRVYRRDPARPSEIVDIVEPISAGNELRFSNVEELRTTFSASIDGTGLTTLADILR